MYDIYLKYEPFVKCSRILSNFAQTYQTAIQSNILLPSKRECRCSIAVYALIINTASTTWRRSVTLPPVLCWQLCLAGKFDDSTESIDSV